MSHLDKPLQLRQINVETSIDTLYLPPNTMMSYNFSSTLHPKLLQLRWDDHEDTSNNGGNNNWCGEIDIGKIGLFYAKLRNPMVILKIQVEVVGSSLVATISEQDLTWPPYRICNNTSFDMHYQQVDNRSQDPLVATIASQAPISAECSQADSVKSHYHNQLLQQRQYEVSKMQHEYHIPVQMDTLPAGAIIPYVWDYPISQQHVVIVMLTLPGTCSPSYSLTPTQ